MTKQYREVARKANVGERIKIVRPQMSGDTYKAGDVFTVTRSAAWDTVDVDKEGHNMVGTMYTSEYVVLEPIVEAATVLTETERTLLTGFVRENADALRKLIDKIAGEGVEMVGSELPVLNRAGVIEQAKADVGELIRIGDDSSLDLPSGTPFHDLYYCVEFHVNREKRAVTALVRKLSGERIAGRAIAKCAPDDVFNADIGKAIALRRALGLEIRSEYVEAPKPNVRVPGQIIRDDSGRLRTLRGNGARMSWTNESAIGSFNGQRCPIVDDTDADYGKEAA